jgi:prolyl oligopeptidase PreP (S9A serine peptidase family)
VGLVVRKRGNIIILLLITTPGTTYSFKAKEINSISKPKVDFKSEDFESKQVFYTKDGNSMIITYKRIEIEW